LNDFAAVKTANAVVYHASNLDVLPFMADNSIDSIVCDPPYELGFMGKAWDSTGIAYSVELWRECLRVLKPGGHLLAFSGSRTYHRMVVAIEDAGFEIRDMISWISNKTFPKSHNIGKAIDKALGADREVIGTWKPTGTARLVGGKNPDGIWTNPTNAELKGELPITAPATDEAKQWDGWGTGLKPTVEPVVMARKPVDGTVADNVLRWGVGGLNIDASRIGTETIVNPAGGIPNGANNFVGTDKVRDRSVEPTVAQGRWPANIILDEYTAALLDEQSGITKSPQAYIPEGYKDSSMFGIGGVNHDKEYGDSGGASRFFYVAKASKRDRNEGLDELPETKVGSFNGNAIQPDGNKIGANPDQPNQPAQNFHPTVKPTDLMRYLIKLVTPAGGIVLDPFTGSGSTGKAALLDGYQFVGIEMTADYLPIIKGRLEWAENEYLSAAEKENETLF
jgi:site-specific DNA-methyltransferase (adenine-specific)